MKRRLTMKTQNALTGLFFVAPFLIGTFLCFLYPTISSFLLSFGDTSQETAGFHIQLKGIENYIRAFTVDTAFVPKLLTAIKNSLIQIPLLVIFSLLIAIMINKVKRFKGFFRVVVLLPFLLGTGNVLQQLMGQRVDRQVLSITDGDIIPREFLMYLGQNFVTAIDTLFGIIVTVLWSSGVQILLFLSAIQSISPALYESAHIDGANEYEAFWKITLPMVAPVLLLNAIYTIINSFISTMNPLLEYIRMWGITKSEHGYAAALGWIYFAFILLFIGLVTLILGKYAQNSQTTGSSPRKERGT